MSVETSTHYRSSPGQDIPSPPASVDEEQNEEYAALPPNESFGDTTYLGMSKQDAARFSQLEENYTTKEIASWVGRGRRGRFGHERSKISIRDARLINQNAKTSIFEIDENHLVQLKVTDSARKTLVRLGTTYNLSETARNLNLYPSFIHNIKNGYTSAISKEIADKIEQQFDTDVFSIHQIFERACTENIDGFIKKREVDNPAQHTIIECDDESRERVKKLDNSTRAKIGKLIGKGVYRDAQSTSVRNAVVINKISKSEIFSFSVQKLVSVPYSRETCARLNEVIEKKIKEKVSLKQIVKNLGFSKYHSLRLVRRREYTKLAFTTADKINTYFGTRIFDFEKLLNEALTDAELFYRVEEIPATKTRKRTEKMGSTPSPVHASPDSASDLPFLEQQDESMVTPIDDFSQPNGSHIDSTYNDQPSVSTNETFADSTYLKIDELAAERLEQLKGEVTTTKISSWVGGKRCYLDRGSDRITMREARLINQYSERSIFEISENHLLEIKVINSARETLKIFNGEHNFRKTAEELGLHSNFLHRIKNGRTKSISIKNANEIENSFQTDVFRIHEIFNRACAENIDEVQTVNDSSELTIIKYDTQRKKEVNELDSTIKGKILKTLGTIIYRNADLLSIRNAVAINQISGSEIFSFSVKNLVAVPLSEEIRNRLIELVKEKVDDEGQTYNQIIEALGIDYNTLMSIKNGMQKKIQLSRAVTINTYFGEPLFNFEKILSEAEQDAVRFYESSQQTAEEIDPPKKGVGGAQTSTGKRKTRDSEGVAYPSKKQKTDLHEEDHSDGMTVNPSPPTHSSLEGQQLPFGVDTTDEYWRTASLDEAFYESHSSAYSPASSYSTTNSDAGSNDSEYYAAPSPSSFPMADIESFFS